MATVPKESQSTSASDNVDFYTNLATAAVPNPFQAPYPLFTTLGQPSIFAPTMQMDMQGLLDTEGDIDVPLQTDVMMVDPLLQEMLVDPDLELR